MQDHLQQKYINLVCQSGKYFPLREKKLLDVQCANQGNHHLIGTVFDR